MCPTIREPSIEGYDQYLLQRRIRRCNASKDDIDAGVTMGYPRPYSANNVPPVSARLK